MRQATIALLPAASKLPKGMLHLQNEKIAMSLYINKSEEYSHTNTGPYHMSASIAAPQHQGRYAEARYQDSMQAKQYVQLYTTLC
jgi:hypothetical protein